MITDGVLVKDDMRCVLYGTRKSFPRDYFKKNTCYVTKNDYICTRNATS